MGVILRGFFVGLFLLVAFTLILATMIGPLIQQDTSAKCNYGCSIQALLVAYQNIWFILLFGFFWLLGVKMMELSVLIKEGSEKAQQLDKKDKNKNFKMPWEYRTYKVEE